jgi:hypothetical protein
MEVVERDLEEVLEVLDRALEHLGGRRVGRLPHRLLLQVVRPVVELVEEVAELVRDLGEHLLLDEDGRPVLRAERRRPRRAGTELVRAVGPGSLLADIVAIAVLPGSFERADNLPSRERRGPVLAIPGDMPTHARDTSL